MKGVEPPKSSSRVSSKICAKYLNFAILLLHFKVLGKLNYLKRWIRGLTICRKHIQLWPADYKYTTRTTDPISEGPLACAMHLMNASQARKRKKHAISIH